MEFKEAFDIVVNQLRNDKDYYRAWRDNISVSFQDTLSWAGYKFPEIQKLSNESAENFINRLIQKIE